MLGWNSLLHKQKNNKNAREYRTCKKHNVAQFTGNQTFIMMSSCFPLCTTYNNTPNLQRDLSYHLYKLHVTQELKQTNFAKKWDWCWTASSLRNTRHRLSFFFQPGAFQVKWFSEHVTVWCTVCMQHTIVFESIEFDPCFAL